MEEVWWFRMLRIAALNLVLYAVDVLVTGGRAVRGRVDDHRYLLRLSGKDTETTAAIYYLNLWHGRLFMATTLMAGYAALRLRMRRRSFWP